MVAKTPEALVALGKGFQDTGGIGGTIWARHIPGFWSVIDMRRLYCTECSRSWFVHKWRNQGVFVGGSQLICRREAKGGLGNLA